MSNDSTLTDPPISVPPTLLISVISRIDDISHAVSLEVKAPGDLVYVLGETLAETGGCELLRCYGEQTRGKAYIGNRVPRVDAETALALYRRLYRCIQKGLVRSVHTPSLGGLGVALAKVAFAGGYGLEIDLRKIPGKAEGEAELLYAESNSRFVVTVAPDRELEFATEMAGVVFARIGSVLKQPRLQVCSLEGNCIIDLEIQMLQAQWQETLGRAKGGC
jgi:phosphoribosylformylglycinamidine synthase